ncbi:MAG TPA: pyridoxal-phosphate dependent enzyme [Pseudomonadales bacterium]|nr:pyridoxal-phosphate dependent enzyme [Pseudomonadales bacterium]
MTPDTVVPPSLAQIRSTAASIAPYINRTPVQRWYDREIVDRFGSDTEIHLKLELFQRTGSFKTRGVLSNMLALSRAQLDRGVTAVSAGNHAIAVAYGAQALGVHAKVVMLKSANPARVDAARAYGAEVVIAPDGTAGFAMVDAIVANEGRTFVHPFEGPLTALGTATVGLELAEAVPNLDAVVIGVGGGGLAGGASAAIKQLQPQCRVYGVEPVGADSMHRSFAAGSPQRIDSISTIADSLAPPMALPYSYALCRANIDALVKVSDRQITDAMGMLYREMKLAVEPGGAAATAALLGPLANELRGRRVGVVVCGSNIDLDSFHRFVGST